MIRLSEMYFIASEYLYKNAKPSEALDLLSTVRYNRGFLDNSSFISSIYDESSFEKSSGFGSTKKIYSERDKPSTGIRNLTWTYRGILQSTSYRHLIMKTYFNP